MIYIYGLFDPRNYQLRYIGKSVNPKQRLRGHIQDGKKDDNSPRVNWIRHLLSEDLEPSMEILEECTEDNWQEIERIWIKECREKGLKLCNISNGGDNPPDIRTLPNFEEIKLKMSKSRKKRPPPNLGRIWSQEYKEKMSEALSGKNNPMYGLKGKDHPGYGRKDSDEVIQMKSERMMGDRNPMYGKTHTDEAKRKLSLAGKGRKQTDEDKLKKSLSCRMHHAQKRDDENLVRKLQKKYFENFSEYHQRYLSYV